MPVPMERVSPAKQAFQARVALEPGISAFESLSLIVHAENVSGLHEWVYRTASSMPGELKRNHHIVFEGLFYAVEPVQSAQSFPELIHQLSVADPLTLRARLMDAYARVNRPKKARIAPDESPDEFANGYDSVLSSFEAYFEFLASHFSRDCINPVVENAAYNLIMDPPAMQKFVVSHMWKIWEDVMEKEWRRVEPLLQQTVQAFQQVSLRDLTIREAVKAVLEVDDESMYEKIKRKLEHVQQLIFVPSAHVGPYHYQLGQASKKWMFFTVRSPRGMTLETPELNQSEILVRLNALTDETRLKILQLIANEGPLTSSQVIDQLGLSQSAASRHLMQLSAAGYLTENRVQGAKQYAVNPKRINETLQGVAAYLLK